MPDIKTALAKALNEWTADDTAHNPSTTTTSTPTNTKAKPYFTVTNNVCRVTFEYVRDNRNKTRVEVGKELAAKGYKAGSVSSLLGQMIKQGLISEVSGFLQANSDTYTPIKSSKALKAMQAKAQAKPERKHVTIVNTRTGEVLNPKPSAGIAALPTKAAPKVEAAPQINSSWDAETLLNHLSIKQARALYDELRKIFGG